MTRAQLKTAAKEQIKGKIGILFVISLIIALISGVISSIPGVGQIASLIVTPAFSLSIVRVYLNLFNGKAPEVKDTFSGFDDVWSAFKVNILVAIYTFLWSLLFVIPGIIKAYSYSQAMYILAENPKMSANEAIRRSMTMMDGHKMELFILSLSFILWYLLCGITFGLAFIYVGPYVNATMANFYHSIKPAEVSEAPVVEAPVTEGPTAE